MFRRIYNTQTFESVYPFTARDAESIAQRNNGMQLNWTEVTLSKVETTGIRICLQGVNEGSKRYTDWVQM